MDKYDQKLVETTHNKKEKGTIRLIKTPDKQTAQKLLQDAEVEHKKNDSSKSLIKRPIRHMDGLCFCYANPNDCTTCSTVSLAESLPENPSFPEWSFIENTTFVPPTLDAPKSSLEDTHDFRTPKSIEIKVDRKKLKMKMSEFRESIRSCRVTLRQIKNWYEFEHEEIGSVLTSIKERIEGEKRLMIKWEDQLSKMCDEIEQLGEVQSAYQSARDIHLKRLVDVDLMDANKLKFREIREKVLNADPLSNVSKLEEIQLESLDKEISKFLRKFDRKPESSDFEMITQSEIENLLTCRSFYEPEAY